MSSWFWILVGVFVAILWFFGRAGGWKSQCEVLPYRPSPQQGRPDSHSNGAGGPGAGYEPEIHSGRGHEGSGSQATTGRRTRCS